MVSAAPNATAITAVVLALRPRGVDDTGSSIVTVKVQAAGPVPGFANVLAPAPGDDVDLLADARQFGDVELVGRVVEGVISMVGPGVVRLESEPPPRLVS